MTLVSILLPVYNAASSIDRAIRSLQRQTFPDFEIIAIDDGSSDNSSTKLDLYAQQDNRLKVFHQPNAGSLSKVLNKAASYAQGKYIARQDADDASAYNRLEFQVKFLEEHPNIGLCGTWIWFVDENFGPMFSYELPDNNDLIVRYMDRGYNPLVHGSVMLRKSIFEKTGGYRGIFSQDLDLWLRFSEISRIGICKTLGYYFWRRFNSISSRSYKMQALLAQLAISFHRERMKYGHEVSSWDEKYSMILESPLAETSTVERDTSVHYAYGIYLLKTARWRESREEFVKASAGEGIYASKAKRNLTYFWLSPLLTLGYRMLQLREPFRYSKILSPGTELPNF